MMSTPRAYNPPSTRREKSSWTPKHHKPSNEKIFVERMALIKKWYHSWSEQQRWVLVEHILRHLSDAQLTVVHDLLHPVMPSPNHDFTRVLPRHLCLRILSYLDPQSLCRAAQVCWYWKYLAECHALWQPKCLTLGWFLPTPPSQFDLTAWKRHYVACVCQLHWNPPEPPDGLNAGGTDELQQVSPTVHERRKPAVIARHSMHLDRRPWRDPDLHPEDIHFRHEVATGLERGGYPEDIHFRHEVATGLERGGYPKDIHFRHEAATGLDAGGYPKDIHFRHGLGGGNRFVQFRSSSRGESHDQINYHPDPMHNGTIMTTSPVNPRPHTTSPPSALIHPTLLEKMRLGSPTPSHIHLSAMNRTQHAVMDEFYRLQDSSPFPRLPPYYVHSSSMAENERDKAQSSPPHVNRKTPISRSELARKRRSVNGEVSTNEGQQLLLHPWNIPGDTPDSED